jgi:hypothetical protein
MLLLRLSLLLRWLLLLSLLRLLLLLQLLLLLLRTTLQRPLAPRMREIWLGG